MGINADDFLRSGDLEGARLALIEVARTAPADVPTRLYLFQLLAVNGDWDKAGKQLTTLARLSPEAAMLATVYGQALAAEREREAVFAGAATAHVHGGSSWAGGVAEAIRLDAVGQAQQADDVRGAAFDAAPDTPGTIDGAGTVEGSGDHAAIAFEWMADADPRFGPVIEAIIGGRYGLLPIDAIAEIESEGPRDLRDLVWFPAEVTLKAGARVAVLLPARYPGIPADPAERLARATGWSEDGAGSGQHLWTFSGGEEAGLLSTRRIRFS